MTSREQDIIGRFFARVGDVTAPPIDPEADRFIADQFSSHAQARYRVTQMAIVQEAALAEARNRIRQLEYQLSQSPPSGQGRGLFGGLFGGSGQPSAPADAPPPSYPPGYQPGMVGPSAGPGFLGSALTTAAGVAGGVLAADAIGSLFSERGGGFAGGGFGGGEVVNETVVNNYAPADVGAAEPWPDGGPQGDAWSDAGGDGDADT